MFQQSALTTRLKSRLGWEHPFLLLKLGHYSVSAGHGLEGEKAKRNPSSVAQWWGHYLVKGNIVLILKACMFIYTFNSQECNKQPQQQRSDPFESHSQCPDCWAAVRRLCFCFLAEDSLAVSVAQGSGFSQRGRHCFTKPVLYPRGQDSLLVVDLNLLREQKAKIQVSCFLGNYSSHKAIK